MKVFKIFVFLILLTQLQSAWAQFYPEIDPNSIILTKEISVDEDGGGWFSCTLTGVKVVQSYRMPEKTLSTRTNWMPVVQIGCPIQYHSGKRNMARDLKRKLAAYVSRVAYQAAKAYRMAGVNPMQVPLMQRYFITQLRSGIGSVIYASRVNSPPVTQVPVSVLYYLN